MSNHTPAGYVKRKAAVLVLVALTVSCQPNTRARTQSPTASPLPTVVPAESPTPVPSSSPTEGLEQLLTATEHFTFVDVPASLERSALAPIRLSTRRKGEIVDSVVRSLDPREGDSIVTVVAIRPLGPADAMEVFGTILQRAAEGAQLSGGSGKLSRAAGGQAFKVEGKGVDLYMSPITDEPVLVLLMVTGRPTEPNEPVVEAILEANSV